jgi:hypothetical protein
MGNRIVGNFKAKLGQEPSKPETELGAEEVKLLKTLRERYKKITDGVKTLPRQSSFKGDEVISDYTELCLMAQYVDLETQEDRHFSRLGSILKDYPIYTEFLEKVKGIGPAMAGVIVSEIDIKVATYPSSLWMYAGLDVAPDGRGRSRQKDHLVERSYTNKAGDAATRVGITFNPFLKTKLTGVLASSFLRAGNERYVGMYAEYKNRLENNIVHATWHKASGSSIYPNIINEIWQDKDGLLLFKAPEDRKGWKELVAPPGTVLKKSKSKSSFSGKDIIKYESFEVMAGDEVIAVYQYGKSKGHRHNMALRYMVKRFLVDLYNAWRPLEGLEVAPEYNEAKLGHKHSKAA